MGNYFEDKASGRDIEEVKALPPEFKEAAVRGTDEEFYFVMSSVLLDPRRSISQAALEVIYDLRALDKVTNQNRERKS